MNTPETINIEKYAEALNNLIGVDSVYMAGDKDVDALVELIVAAKKLENRVKELVDEKERCLDALAELSDNIGLLKEKAVTDTVHKMQTMIKEECLAGGIYPAFVARVVERVGEKLLEENNV